MKKLLIAISVTALGSISANAADLAARPYYSKAPVAETIASWTGGYIGVNVGGGITHSPASNDVGDFTLITFHNAADLSSAGVIGGAQIGYNWQFAPTWVFGLEADIQGSSQSGRTTVTQIPFVVDPDFFSLESRLNYFGTARARLGFLATPSLLLYATGGFAWGDTELNLSSSDNGTRSNTSFHDTNIGWTVGGGIESKISTHWSIKAEYLYLDLGKNTVTSVLNPPPDPFAHSGSVDFRDHIVRVGLNYNF